MPPYSPQAIANRFLDLADQAQNRDLSPMKLQKLIYYAHAWSLAIYGSPLINKEIEAWKFGPVLPDIYHEFKGFGNSRITSRANELIFSGNSLKIQTPQIASSDAQSIGLIDEVWRIYGAYTPVQLSNLTHAEDSPWYEVAKQYPFSIPKNATIPNELIKARFIEKQKRGEG